MTKLSQILMIPLFVASMAVRADTVTPVHPSERARATLDRALENLDQSIRFSRQLNSADAQARVRTAQDIFTKYDTDSNLREAVQELDHLLGILRDRNRAAHEVIDENVRSVGYVRDLVTRSDTYRNDPGDEDPAPTDPDVLGQTAKFNSGSVTTEFITVDRATTYFPELELKAVDGGLRIESFQVFFDYGPSVIFHGGFLRQDDYIRIDLRRDSRPVRSIRVTASGEGLIVARAVR